MHQEAAYDLRYDAFLKTRRKSDTILLCICNVIYGDHIPDRELETQNKAKSMRF